MLCEHNYCIKEMFSMNDKEKLTIYEFVPTSYENTDDVSNQTLFILPHLPKHAGQNDVFLL